MQADPAVGRAADQLARWCSGRHDGGKHPRTGEPYNPDFAAMARSAGIDGVSVDRAADLGDAVRAALAAGRPYLIDANIDADQNPQGAGVWELPGLGRSRPGIGGRYEPGH
jgi:acetolactate synthase-1/2/3 large subunit